MDLVQMQIMRVSDMIGSLDSQLSSRLEQLNSIQGGDFKTWVKTPEPDEPDSLEPVPGSSYHSHHHHHHPHHLHNQFTPASVTSNCWGTSFAVAGSQQPPQDEIRRLKNLVAQLERVRDELTLQNLTLKSQLSDMRIRLSEIPASPPDSGIDPDASGTSSSSSTSSIPISPRPVSSTNNSKAKRYATYKKQESIFSGDLKNMRLLIASSKRNESELKKRIHELEGEKQDLRRRNEELLGLLASATSPKTQQQEQQLLLQQQREQEGSAQLAAALHRVHELETQVQQSAACLEEERFLRMRYHNEVQDLKGKIRVFCRVKPLQPAMGDGRAVVMCRDLQSLSVAASNDGSRRSFSFDRVFGPNDGQDTVFCDVRGLIQSAVDGYNVCICAYGQTGSGKTHTMLGDDANPGIAPRAFDELFRLIRSSTDRWHCSVSAVMLELYQDRLIDLLRPSVLGSDSSVPRLEIKRDAGGLVHVAGACVQPVASATELRQLFHEGAKGRHRGTTRMNVDSSRSHLVLSLLVETRSRLSGATLRGKLSLIDLAGSERVSKSGAISCGTLLKEAASINRSLFALGDVIAALVADAPHIPYRNSKLTSLMQDCLGGRAKTLMIINVSAAACNLDETISSLMYGTRVKQVTNAPLQNQLNGSSNRSAQ